MARYTKTGSINTVGQINAELDLIAEAIGDTFSRVGDSPNQLETALDANSNRIINLPAPAHPNDPARFVDVINSVDVSRNNDLTSSYTFPSVALMKASTIVFPIGKKIFFQGYYTESDGGSNSGIVKSGAHTEDGGSIFTLADGKYIEANQKGKVYLKKWGVRVGDSRTHENENSNSIERAIAAYPLGGTLVYPLGTTVIKRAVQLTRGWALEGASRKGSILKRYSTEAEVLGGLFGSTIIYIADTWVDVRNITISGDLAAKDIEGITFANDSPPSHCNFTSIDVVGCFQAFKERIGLFMCTFRDVNVASCVYGFIFDSNVGKTSLNFISCYASSIDLQPWQFVQTVYSSLLNCGADVVNTSSKNTELGVYDFFICTMTMDSCGTENGCFGNGAVRARSSLLVINGLVAFGWGTEYVPNYAATPNYALGPIQCDGAFNTLVITAPRIENTVLPIPTQTGPVADMLAFNSTNTSGNEVMVNLLSLPTQTANSIKGQGDISKYVITSAEIRDTIASALATKQLSGNGTIITLPITAQTGANRKHMIKISSIAANFSGTVARAVEANFAFVSLNSITDLDSWNLKNAVITTSGMNIVITLPFTTFDPLLAIELTLSEQKELIEYSNITIT
jgi:hypothetical protein